MAEFIFNFLMKVAKRPGFRQFSRKQLRGSFLWSTYINNATEDVRILLVHAVFPILTYIDESICDPHHNAYNSDINAILPGEGGKIRPPPVFPPSS